MGAGEEGGSHGGDVERPLQPQHLQLLLCRRRCTAHHQILKGHASLLVFYTPTFILVVILHPLEHQILNLVATEALLELKTKQVPCKIILQS